MIHLKKFNENTNSSKDSIYNIALYLADINDKYGVAFATVDGEIIDIEDIKKDSEFNFSVKKYNFIKSEFTVIIHESVSYNDWVDLSIDMQQFIEYIGNDGWELTNYNFSKKTKPLSINDIWYIFSKPDTFDRTTQTISTAITKRQIVKTFEDHYLKITQRSITYQNNYNELEGNYDIDPDDLSEWIEINGFRLAENMEGFNEDEKNTFLEVMLKNICEKLGGDEWTLHNGRHIRIYFKN